jgi:hypothetical protein
MSDITDSSEMSTIGARVTEILKRFPSTRNSDAELYARYYERYYGKAIILMSVKEFFRLLRTKEIDDPDNIRRMRAKVQNKQVLYLPTDPDVRKIRLKNRADHLWNVWQQKEREMEKKS